MPQLKHPDDRAAKASVREPPAQAEGQLPPGEPIAPGDNRAAQRVLESSPPPADTRISYGPHPAQFGDLRLPRGHGPHPLVIMIHGGFWRARYDLEHTGHVCAALTAAGAATWNIEYRRLGDAGGWPNTFLDVAQAVDYARRLAPQFLLDLERVLVVGHSAGGQLALWAAGRRRLAKSSPLYQDDPLVVRTAVALAAVSDLRRAWQLRLSGGVVEQLLGGTPHRAPERYASASPIELLPLNVAQILVHGTHDADVPYALSEGYCATAAAKGDQAKLFSLPGAGHFEPIDPSSSAWQSLQDLVMQQLR